MRTSNLNIHSFEPLASPREVTALRAVGADVAESVARHRDGVRDLLAGRDDRFLVVVGPCSIHDAQAALDFAGRLADLAGRVKDRLAIVMRVYFEKPRTSIGWKGLINDPRLDGSNDIMHGLGLARSIMLDIAATGLACGTEFLDPIVPQYTSDLVSWAAIGARTTESQTHRQMASGLSMPVGFKNSTDGGLQAAVDAMTAARHPHAFVGIDDLGQISVVRTTGNADVHLILRGGSRGPNYSKDHVEVTKELLAESASGVARPLLVDCSHGNSSKDYRNQPGVFEEVVGQFADGETALLGAMLESNLVAGRQDVQAPKLTYGQSVTDGCLDWETTERLLLAAHRRLGGAGAARLASVGLPHA